MQRKKIVDALLLLPLLFLLSCVSSDESYEGPRGFIQIKGSDTMVNAAQKLAEDFMKDYPYVFVAVTGGGSGVGIASLINGTCDIAIASRKMRDEEIEIAKKRGVEPKEFVVAYDGVAVIVNKNNPIDSLTIEQLHDIFTGKITDWKELGGKEGKVVTLSREVSSGTHMYFKEKVIRREDKNSREEFSPQTLLLSSSQAIVEEVVSNENAIGYLGMGYVSERVKAIKVGVGDSFYPPSVEYVSGGKYILSRPLQMYTNGVPKGVVKLFIDYVYSPEGQRAFQETGFVPISQENAPEKD